MLDFQKGDKRAFEVIMQKYYPRLLNFIYRFIGDRSLAEDLAQDVFLKIYHQAGRYKVKSKLSTWIFTIARNTSLNEVRRKKKHAFSLDQTHGNENSQMMILAVHPQT